MQKVKRFEFQFPFTKIVSGILILLFHISVKANIEKREEIISENSFSLNVDFSATSSPVQVEYNGYLAEHENGNSFLPQTYIISGESVTIDAEWPEGTENTAMQMIDRGSSSAINSDLLRDWIGTDGRVAKVPMKLDIKGLPPGKYDWKSYHHDNMDHTGIFNVKVTDASGTAEFTGIDISNGNLSLEDVTVFQTSIISDGADISFEFEMASYPDNSTSFFVMNGFSLSGQDTTLVPGDFYLTGPINQIKYLSVNPELSWTESAYAGNYKLNLGTSNPPDFYADVNETKLPISGLQSDTQYFWQVEALNANGSVKSEIRSFTTGNSESSFSEKMQLQFSKQRNYYNEPFQLKITCNNPESCIIYTLDCSDPSVENGIILIGTISIDSSLVVKAVALSGDSISDVFTQTYLFTSRLENQPKNPNGFPEYWGGSSVIQADYEMDTEIINAPEYQPQIDSAFKSIPSLSLSMDVADWFDYNQGVYTGYPNSDITHEKAVTAEFIFSTDEENFAVECGVQNQGGTSIVDWKVPKQSMRLLFKKMYGPGTLKYKLFPDSEIESINTLVVDGLLYSWLHPWDNKQRVTSLYFRDQLASDMQNEMGWLSFHGRYVNLFINGLYWGIYDLHERPDDAFMAEYLEADREDFDIIKHNPNTVVSGSNASYKEMLKVAREGLSTPQALKNIQKYLDLPAFIDYMILNFYLGNYDWAHQNYYAARNKTRNTGFRFYTWDAEHVMRYSDVNYNNLDKDDEGGPTELHTLLKQNPEYRMMFADAVYRHFFNDGVLTPENFEKSFKSRKNEIDKAIILESARWGDYREDIAEVTYTKNEYWEPEVNKVLKDYIPRRRDVVISQLKGEIPRLFPVNMPPLIKVEEINSTEKRVTLTNPNFAEGAIYYTLDGSDPRKEGGAVRGLKYTQPITVANTSVIRTRFLSQSMNEWTVMAEKLLISNDVYGKMLVIDEIMYHPEEGKPEFIEMLNTGEELISLDGLQFTDGIDYSFSNAYLLPQKGLVLTNDSALFRTVYGFGAFGQYEKKLDNGGETIILKNRFDQLVDSVSYTDTVPWPVLADGQGYSLELIAPDSDNALAVNWKASDTKNGTPFKPEIVEEVTASLYPNPFSGKVTIATKNQDSPYGNYNIEIYNQFGSKIREFEIQSYNFNIEINLSQLQTGLYIFRITNLDDAASKSFTLKAIKI